MSGRHIDDVRPSPGRYLARLAVGFGRPPGLVGMCTAGTHPEEQIYLVLGQRPVAGARCDHKVTHKLDLGLQIVVREVVIFSIGGSHATNLPRMGPACPAKRIPWTSPGISTR
jgi:hypothetical protein